VLCAGADLREAVNFRKGVNFREAVNLRGSRLSWKGRMMARSFSRAGLDPVSYVRGTPVPRFLCARHPCTPFLICEVPLHPVSYVRGTPVPETRNTVLMCEVSLYPKPETRSLCARYPCTRNPKPETLSFSRTGRDYESFVLPEFQGVT